MGRESPVRLGIVGAGSLGFHHVRIAGDLDHVERVGFFDLDPRRRERVEAELGAHPFETLDDLLQVSDAVIIATPTTTHRSVAVEALRRGIHVFIEKPIASSLDEADAILKAADTADRLVQVGHVERFNDAIVGARPHLDTPLFIESHRLAPFTERGTDVAVVLDLMIHDVDLVQGLVGRPIAEIHATGIPVLTPSVDIANARITFEGGAVANLTASRVSLERMRKLRIFQRSGYLSLDLAQGTGEFLRLREALPALDALKDPGTSGGGFDIRDMGALIERIPLAVESVEPLRREQESFRDAILGRREPEVPGAQGRRALETALSIEHHILRHVADTRSK